VIPRATYRVQLSRTFTFERAASVVPYVRDLGISHLYLSPIFDANSDHGYDVIDPTRLNPDLGSFEALVAAGMPMIVDIVPNHMAASMSNAWWRDVVENGRDSEYARVFDIDWERGGHKLVLPFRGSDEYRENENVRLVDAQSTERNYRRFFDVNELVAVRVEDPWVFDLTHSLAIDLVRRGAIDGVRVDHVDGLRDPGAYLTRLRDALGPDAYIVVEKILSHGEELPSSWPVDGTTGYDFIAVADGVFVDPEGLSELAQGYPDFEELARDAKRQVLREYFAGEVAAIDDPSVVDRIVALDVYRTYGEEADPRVEQLSDPAMAKGVEDTAFYRYPVLLSRNEVGCEPTETTNVDEFHDFARRRSVQTMNASSTHDTKRSEDARARIDVLSEMPDEWRALTERWTDRLEPGINPADVQNFYQSVVGSYVEAADYVDRLLVVMQKSVREAKRETSWRDPDEAYEEAVEGFVRRALNDDVFIGDVRDLLARIEPAALANSLGRVVLKIFTPGVPDFYQGSENFNYRLVDPDNRAPASFDGHGVKYELIKRCLALPRDGAYEPVIATGEQADHVIAFRRGRVLAVVSRLVLGLGPWGDTAVEGRPAGELLEALPVFVGAD
jgi:(1->4)-alpha-D-glucan 1-alpha-D-glucosylmutase